MRCTWPPRLASTVLGTSLLVALVGCGQQAAGGGPGTAHPPVSFVSSGPRDGGPNVPGGGVNTGSNPAAGPSMLQCRGPMSMSVMDVVPHARGAGTPRHAAARFAGPGERVVRVSRQPDAVRFAVVSPEGTATKLLTTISVGSGWLVASVAHC
ncbi:MAG: hypothetical protein ACRDPG_13915 [Nocardioidaceae bacterium]